MKTIIDKIEKEFNNKINIEILEENDKITKLNIIIHFKEKDIIQDYSILNEYISYEQMKGDLHYLVHDALDKYLGGE